MSDEPVVDREDVRREVIDVLRRHGYRIPGTEEEARAIRQAVDFLVDSLADKKSIRTRARIAFTWTVVSTLTLIGLGAILKAAGKLGSILGLIR